MFLSIIKFFLERIGIFLKFRLSLTFLLFLYLVCDPVIENHVCVVVQTVVIVFLDEGEDQEEIRSLILSGFNEAINDGSFYAALRD